MSEALKPCPFCGKVPEVTTRDVEPQGDSWYGESIATFVLCDCGACLFDGLFHEGFGNTELAIAAWNTRAPDAALLDSHKKLVEALKAAIPAIKCAHRDATLSDDCPSSYWRWHDELEAAAAALREAERIGE